MNAEKAVEKAEDAPAMKVGEPVEVPIITSHETAETGLKDRMKELENLRAALVTGEAATNEPAKKAEDDKKQDDKPVDRKAPEEETAGDSQEQTGENKDDQAKIDWKAEAERLKAEQRKKDGIRGSELEKLRRKVEELSGQLHGKQDAEITGKPVADAMDKAQAAKDSAYVEKEPTEAELIEEYGANYEAEVGREWAVTNWKAINRKLHKVQREWDAKLSDTVKTKLAEIKLTETVAKTMEDIEAIVPGAQEIDANATTNGFAEYLDQEDPDMPEFTRREIAERMIVAITRGKSPKTSLDKLAKIYAGFTGTEPRSPANGKNSAMRKDDKSESQDDRSEAQPEKEQYIMPSSRGTDKKPLQKQYMTVTSYEEELRKNRGGNFDATVSRLLEKVRNGEVISG